VGDDEAVLDPHTTTADGMTPMLSSSWTSRIAVLALGLLGAWSSPRARAVEPSSSNARFEFTLKRDATTSAGIYDVNDRLVRTLWSVKPLTAGRHSGEWDGVDQLGRTRPPGEYRYRVIANHGSYRNVGIIGNSGATRAEHTPGIMDAVAVDDTGAVYTANEWEEAGADFKKWDVQGTSVFDADFRIRNGQPNGVAYAIAVDDRYLYCAVAGWPRAPFNGKQQVQRFRRSDGVPEPFPGLSPTNGHIQVYEWPERKIPRGTSEPDAALMRTPLRGLAVDGDSIFVADTLGGKVHRFARSTGLPVSEYRVRLPVAVAAGPDGRIWVGHERRKVSVFDREGQTAELVIDDLGEVRGLAFGPGDRLYVADGGTGQLKIYQTGGNVGAKRIGGFGRKAVAGEDASDRFYDLRGVAVDSRGNFVTIQGLPLGGARLARWSPVGTPLWERSGLEFVSLGTYSRQRPDEFLSLQFNRYHLSRQGTPTAEFRGNLFAGDARYRADVHGVPRIVTIGSHELFYTAQGDGMQVFRRVGDELRPSAMIGGRWPTPDGRRDERLAPGQWTWHDADGNGAVDRAELAWFRKPGAGRYDVLGFNVDERGTLLYCDQNTKAIWELPMVGVDTRGNPRYRWNSARVLVARDTTEAALTPLMAVRSPEGALYALNKSVAWKEPKNAGAWMGGWVLSRHDAEGTRLWAVPLPEVCVGLDAVPGGGVVVGWYEKGHVYHYDAEGLQLGTAVPGAASGGVTGWLDNTAALAANRDPTGRPDRCLHLG